jgi:hypothetical protein
VAGKETRHTDQDNGQPDQDVDIRGNLCPGSIVHGQFDDGVEGIVRREDLRDPLWDLRKDRDEGWGVQKNPQTFYDREEGVSCKNLNRQRTGLKRWQTDHG